MTKLVILAGGKGTRLIEFTKDIPKPMTLIGDLPILLHLMYHYNKFGIKDFIICAGYKKKLIDQFFKKKINKKFKQLISSWNINIVNTGLKTNTGGRIGRIKKYLSKDDYFLLTYGDALSDVNIRTLINFFKKKKKDAVITVVKKKDRYGAVILKNDTIHQFDEKKNFKRINGGYMVLSKKILKYIKNDSDIFEKKVLEKLAKEKKLAGFNHNGFWQCVDNFRDWEHLNELYQSKNIRNIFVK